MGDYGCTAPFKKGKGQFMCKWFRMFAGPFWDNEDDDDFDDDYHARVMFV